MKQKPAKANSIEKTLAILLSFSPYNQEIGTGEISQKLGFHKATVSRILLTPTRSAFLEKNPQPKKFRLGPSIRSLGSAATRSVKTNMVRIAKPYTDELRDILRETIVLEVPSGKRKQAIVACEICCAGRKQQRHEVRAPFYLCSTSRSWFHMIHSSFSSSGSKDSGSPGLPSGPI